MGPENLLYVKRFNKRKVNNYKNSTEFFWKRGKEREREREGKREREEEECSTTGITNVMACNILSDIIYKRSLAANWK